MSGVKNDVVRVCCCLKTGGDFGWPYVERLKAAIDKHATVEHKFICFSDLNIRDAHASGIYNIPLVYNWPAWWSKIEIFRLTGTVVYFDLDTVITGSLDNLFTAIKEGEQRFVMRRNTIKNVWSSNVVAWKGDYRWLVETMLAYPKRRFRKHHRIYNLVADDRCYRGDQDWIAAKLDECDEKIQPVQELQSGIYSYKRDVLARNNVLPSDASIVVFHGSPRPHEVVGPPDWLRHNWIELCETPIIATAPIKVSQPRARSESIASRLRHRRKAKKAQLIHKKGIFEWRPPLKRRFGRVPKLWNGDTVFILGGGPSLRAFDVSKLNGQHVIAVNNSYKLAYFAEVLFFGDCWWFEAHRKALQSFPGTIITTCQYEINAFHRVIHVRQKLNRFGLLGNSGVLIWNLNAGACSVDLAVAGGAKTIVLLGYDMRQIDGRNNWHSDHATSCDSNHNPYPEFLLAWPYIAADALAKKVRIINATPNSALTCFPIVDPNTLLRTVL